MTPDFPLVLTTGRVAQQWHTMTRTGKSPSLLEAEPHPFLELHPDDAAGFTDGERVRVRSRRGSATLRVRISDAVSPGVAFAPFHWGALHLEAGATAVNAVTIAFAKELEATRIKVNAACPGFTATDLNRFRGTRTVEQAAREPVRLALLDASGPTGSFSNEAGPLPW